MSDADTETAIKWIRYAISNLEVGREREDERRFRMVCAHSHLDTALEALGADVDGEEVVA